MSQSPLRLTFELDDIIAPSTRRPDVRRPSSPYSDACNDAQVMKPPAVEVPPVELSEQFEPPVPIGPRPHNEFLLSVSFILPCLSPSESLTPSSFPQSPHQTRLTRLPPSHVINLKMLCKRCPRWHPGSLHVPRAKCFCPKRFHTSDNAPGRCRTRRS
ncbi:hypothetical protein PAXRUDRAFT_449191 [Paxillus rubicundulus Ve08.2h10]|uniref:Uncharacterized protein n=1 Tax=Paxillus rubicundulus Ve08.2h10 TaxID=930991 RepID=A0A0D0DBC2_9AGAM|nr:hypothetical protein PAXRUDRAFT_449191 [Paxillus rubicundulus Ve08.2h10]